jgi:hypothetical protein
VQRTPSSAVPLLAIKDHDLITQPLSIDACSANQKTTNSQIAPPSIPSSNKITQASGMIPKAKLFASTSMAQTPVQGDNLAHICTPAPSVEMGHILLNCALCDLIFPIVTPFKHWKWSELLKKAGILDEFSEVPKGLCNGFNVGLDSML